MPFYPQTVLRVLPEYNAWQRCSIASAWKLVDSLLSLRTLLISVSDEALGVCRKLPEKMGDALTEQQYRDIEELGILADKDDQVGVCRSACAGDPSLRRKCVHLKQVGRQIAPEDMLVAMQSKPSFCILQFLVWELVMQDSDLVHLTRPG